MKRQNKKGFTIVELVIVISVIAILSAVLIPVFSGIVDKANRSADEQALRQMNVVLATEEVDDDVTVFDVFDSLADAGLDAKDYKALAKGMAFFWDSEINRVLYVDTTTGTSVLPAEYKDRTNAGKWFSLTQAVQEIKPSDGNYSGKTVAVTSGNQLSYVINNDVQDGSVDKITLSSNVDMMGSAFNAGSLKNDLVIEGTGSQPVVIKNATAVNAKKTVVGGKEGQDGYYDAGMFTNVPKGKTLTIKNVVIENINLKDTNGGNCGFLVGTLSGTLILENVTIKNSTIIAHRSVGALVGYIAGGKIIFNGKVNIENVSVQTVAGRAGKVFGYLGNPSASPFELNGTDAGVYMSNVSLSIHKCERNVGVYQGTTLGLNGNQLTATELESTGVTTTKARIYFADANVGLNVLAAKDTHYGFVNSIIK